MRVMRSEPCPEGFADDGEGNVHVSRHARPGVPGAVEGEVLFQSDAAPDFLEGAVDAEEGVAVFRPGVGFVSMEDGQEEGALRSGRTCDPVFRHGSRPVGGIAVVPPEVVQMLLHGRFPPDGEAASCFLPGVGEPSVPEVGPPEGSEVDEGHASEAEAEEEEVPCEGEVGFGVEVESCQTLETGGIQGAFGGGGDAGVHVAEGVLLGAESGGDGLVIGGA